VKGMWERMVRWLRQSPGRFSADALDQSSRVAQATTDRPLVGGPTPWRYLLHRLRLRLLLCSLKTPASRTVPHTICVLLLSAPCAPPTSPSTPASHPAREVIRARERHLDRPLSASPHITKLLLSTSSSHGCSKVLQMDVRALSGHLAAYCRKPHPRVRLSLCSLWPLSTPVTQLTMCSST